MRTQLTDRLGALRAAGWIWKVGVRVKVLRFGGTTAAIIGALAVVLLNVLPVASPRTGYAAFPGTNGKIAFISLRDGDGEIYVMNADGTGVTQLTNSASASEPTWSPDGMKIVFPSSRHGSFSEVYVMNADGTGQTRLTTDGATNSNAEPAWSPNGAKIAFHRHLTPTPNDGEIYVMNADGTGETRLTNNGIFDGEPAWSPDGSKIAFVRGPSGGNLDIYVMNANGSGVMQVTSNPALDRAPDWSPDGAKIAFTRGGFGAQGDIFVINADGTGETQLTSTSTIHEGAPAWSPDGTKIAFNSTATGNGDIHVMNANGSGVAPLATHSAVDDEPAWQPAYSFTGFFPPVDNLPTLNSVRAGSAVPVKFSLNGNQGLDIFASGYPRSEQIPCGSTALVDGVEQTDTAGSSSLSYDPSTDQYVYVWKTERDWAGTCRQLNLRLKETTNHRANFTFP